MQSVGNGNRFTSINPDLFAGWQLTDKLQIFAELNSQTHTSPTDGWGLITDSGFYYLLTPRVSLDAELGLRVRGNWGFQRYIGAGFAILLG